MNVVYRASNSRSDYYEVATSAEKRVTVVHTQFGTYVCLTDRTINCDHTHAVEDFVIEHGPPGKVVT